MKTVTTPVTVGWGDCDPAGIVFYPRFLAWFDAGTWNLFASVGVTWATISADPRLRGFPLLDAQASFRHPCRPADALVVTSGIAEWRERTFVVAHTIHLGEVEAVTGREVRTWGVAHPEDPQRLVAAPMPPELRARFQD